MSEPSDISKLEGTVLAGRYRILELLGEGGMGSVYLGEHISLQQKRAIKVLHRASTDPIGLARFVRGSRNAARIDHPNVCRVFDYGDPPDGIHFLAMEFVEGESLDEILEREGALPIARAVSIILQTADGLSAAHDLGIVHRDLKPANIMLTSDASGHELVKVVDFDIAKGPDGTEDSDLTGPGWFIGTPEYMSPEQFLGGSAEPQSDIYSLGIILYRTLTADRPWPKASGQAILYHRLHDAPRTLTEVCPNRRFPVGVQEVIDRALRPKPEDRWASAGEFASALKIAAESRDDRTVAAAPDELATRVASRPATLEPATTGSATMGPVDRGTDLPARMKGRTAAIGGTVALVGLAALSFVWLGGGDPDGTPGDGAAAAPQAAAGSPGAVTNSDGENSNIGDGLPDGPNAEDENAGDRASEPGGVASTGDDAAMLPYPPAEAQARLRDLDGNFIALSLADSVPDEVAREANRIAARIWETEAYDASIRAQAADIRSRAFGYLEDAEEQRRWAEEAVRLAPEVGIYQSRLDMGR